MLQPRPYQQVAIERAYGSNLILADECGLGKTLVAIETIREIYKRVPRPTLIVCPKRVAIQWVEALVIQGIDTPNLDRTTLLGAAGAGLPELIRMEDIIITHYESLTYIGDALAAVHWGVVVYDEAHRLKNRKTKRWPYAQKIGALRKICLTGTPMEKLPSDMWTMLNWVAPDYYRSYWAFYGKYVNETRNYLGYRQAIGGKNLPQLAEEIKPYFLRRTKEEVAPDLPAKIEQEVHVEMTDEQADIYKQIKHAKDIEVNVIAPEWSGENITPLLITNVLAKITRLQQVASDPNLLGFTVKSAKIEWLEDYLEDNANEPIVVFTRFRDTAIELAKVFDGDLIVGGAAYTMTGEAFCTGKKRLLFGTIAAMGEGLNLQRAKTAIFLDQEWSQTKMQQAVDRVHRMNITEPKNIVYLTTLHTVDQLVMKALTQKWSETRLVMEYLNEQ